MKKFLGLLVLILSLNGCDDGDVNVDVLNFDAVTSQVCGDVIYKINNNEALFIKIPADRDPFKNEITPPNEPRIIPIGGEVVVRYRSYTGNITSDNLCPNVIQPISPIATIEWVAITGTIEITTTAVMSTPDPITGATKLVQYNHNIVFRDIIFAKPVGQQAYDKYTFGDYATTATPLPLAFASENAALCPAGTTIYNVASGGTEAMYIQNIDPALLSTAVLNTPKTGLISATTNKLTYRLFWVAHASGTYGDYFCSDSFPLTPGVREEWLADDGVANTSGIIEVTTTTNGPGVFKHAVRLKGVTFRNGQSTFYYGNDILFGEPSM